MNVPTVAPRPANPTRPLTPLAAVEAIRAELARWPGVTWREQRFGGLEFRRNRRELGHLHARIADLPFPREERDALVAAGRAQPHDELPDSGWVRAPIRTQAEIETALELFRANYRRSA